MKQNFYSITEHIRRNATLEDVPKNRERCKVGGTIRELFKNAVFSDFLVIFERKGERYMPEIWQLDRS